MIISTYSSEKSIRLGLDGKHNWEVMLSGKGWGGGVWDEQLELSNGQQSICLCFSRFIYRFNVIVIIASSTSMCRIVFLRGGGMGVGGRG